MACVIGIGALGGSGTRAVAQFIIDLGVYLGDDLNFANDNLLFTPLFRNPTWYGNVSDFSDRLKVFESY